MRKKMIAMLLVMLLLLPVSALGSEYDASVMEGWLSRFCDALGQLPVKGDPQQTADPARPGEYLMEYAFGTVTAVATQGLQRTDIREIDVRTSQVTDPRGMRVGMHLDEVLQGAKVGRSSTQLYVLSTQDAGYGFSWAYLGNAGVYGAEFITYGGAGATMKEYTLTYVLNENKLVSAIRVKCADATQAQAEQAMHTAEEIAQRQRGEVYAVANQKEALSRADMQLMGVAVLGMPVDALVAALGEPVEVQMLAQGQGRLLLYEGVTVTLRLNEQTGEEIVSGVSASDPAAMGPRGVCAGMSVQEASSLYLCEEDVYAVGGVMYMQGEAAGEAPYGELVRGALTDEVILRYITKGPSVGMDAVLEIGVCDGVVTHWHFFDKERMAYGNN